MSHFSINKIKLKNPNRELLVQAIKQMASDLGFEIVDKIRDFNGNTRTDFLIGIKNKVFHRGVGIREDGSLVGDFWGIPTAEREKLARKIIQYYTINAVVSSLRSMGYNIQVQKGAQQHVVIAEGI